MKKQILPKTLLFIFIFAFINIFISIFGKENSLIGVIVITMLLMLLQRNLAISPIKNTFKLVGINLFLGVFSFLAIQNIFLGIVCNLVAMFIVAYLFSYNLRSHLDVAFGLLYLFMIGAPVSLDQLPLRLTSLAAGALIIMISQILVNKNKLEKTSDKVLMDLGIYIAQKAEYLKDQNDYSESLDLKINNSMRKIKTIIYDNRKKGFFLTGNGSNVFNIVFNFERINTMLDDYRQDTSLYNSEDLSTISYELNNLKSYLNKDINQSEINFKNSMSTELYEFYDAMENIYFYLNEYTSNSSEKNIYDNLEIPYNFKKSYIYKDHISTKSMKFTYATKVAIGIALGGFIMDYFNLKEGRWILYTIFSVIQPYTEDGIIKTKKRLFGTILGCISVFILFSIFKDPTLRAIIIIFTGYISGYAKEIDYKYEMICITISAIGSVSMLTSPDVFIVNRVAFIALGIIIALIINKLILPYNANTAYEVLLDMYRNVIKEMETEVQLSVDGDGNLHKVKNLLLIANLLEDKLVSMNNLVKDKNQYEVLNKKRLLINSMYCIYLKFKRNNEMPIYYNLAQLEEAKDLIIEDIETTNDIDHKVICKNLLYIIENSDVIKVYA